MKKSMLVLTAALMFGGLASAQTAATASAPQVPALTDVPAGHWAKDAIDRLVSRGIILGYPDGTFRGTQNLTRYEAAVIIARLLEQMASGNGPAVGGDDLVALQNAVQELAADLAALGVRVSDLEENAVSKDDFSRLEARVEELALAGGDTTAVADLKAQIDDLTARADEYDTLRADVDDNASSIAALNDLTVLLNQDILDLQDRVSAVEAAQADFVTRADFDNLSTKVTGIDTRVTTLEKAPKFSVSGTVSASYGRLNPVASYTVVNGQKVPAAFTHFDVDRLTRQTFADGVYTGGTAGVVCGDPFSFKAAGSVACPDTNKVFSGGYIVFGVKASSLTTADGKFVVNNAAVNFYASNAFGNPNNGGVVANIDNISMDGTLNGQKFDVRYEPYRSSFKFTDYLFANDNANYGTDTATGRRGIVANIQADQLPLKPKLTVVTGYAQPYNPQPAVTYTGGKDVTYTVNGKEQTTKVYTGYTANPNAQLQGYYYGLRASVNPADLGTFGVSFAQMDGGDRGTYTYTYASAVDTTTGVVTYTSGTGTYTTLGRSALGLDWDLGFGAKNADGNKPFSVKGEYIISVPHNQASFITGGGTVQNAFNMGNQLFYTDVKGDLGMVKLGANYRSIDPAYGNGVAGMSVNNADYWGASRTTEPYGADQKGFGVAAATNIGPVALAGFYDSMTDYAGADRQNAFGVAAGIKFFGLKALGFYNSVAVNGTGVALDTNNYSYNSYSPYMDIADVPFNWSSSYGGILSHDGKASDAIVKNLNFTVADQYFYTAKANDLQVYGDYSGTLAGITIAPFARYHMFSTPSNAAVDDGHGEKAVSYNAYKIGAKLSTQPMTSIPLQPSLFGNIVARETSVTGGAKASELLGQAGITLNQVFIPNLKASLGYSYYQGFGVGRTDVGQSASGASATYSAKADRIYANPGGGASSPFTGDNVGTANGKVSGVFAQADWLGLQANYGVFNYTDLNTNTTNVAQGFKVSYTFKF